MQLEEK